MKVSRVLVNLTGSDILSIINEFLDIKELELKEVTIKNEICIKGNFKKGIKINFEGAIDNINVINGKIIARFSRFKVYKLGIIRPIRSLALKIGFDFIKKDGIVANKEKIEIDVKKLLKDFKFLNLEIEDIKIVDEFISVEVDEIDLNLGLLNKKDEKAENILDKKEEQEEETLDVKEVILEEENVIDVIEIEEVKEENDFNNYEAIEESKKKLKNDCYERGREKVDSKFSENVKSYSDYIFIIPDLLALIYRLLRDERVSIKTKLSVSASIAYIACPSDLIPSKIPIIGKIDDIAVLFFALNRLANDVPVEVMLENWSGKNELIFVLRNGLEYITNFTGAKNIEKIYKVVEELSSL